MWFENAFVPDLIVERKVVIEVKAVRELRATDFMQLLTYLRLMDLRLGFLINFHAAFFKAGVRRVVNNY